MHLISVNFLNNDYDYNLIWTESEIAKGDLEIMQDDRIENTNSFFAGKSWGECDMRERGETSSSHIIWSEKSRVECRRRAHVE